MTPTPTPERKCQCGEPWTKGVIHRTDDPCYWPPREPSTPESRLRKEFDDFVSELPSFVGQTPKDVIADFFIGKLSSECERAREEGKEREEQLAESLLDMYEQYCGDGHDFMPAGERASSILRIYGYATFDQAGRILSLTHTKL